jgi:ssDNA-binding replication factor A large subunit
LAVEGFFENKREPVEAKVGELTPQSRAVNVTAKVVSKSEIREIPMGRDGSAHKVCDALVGDETGVVYLTLWDDNITKINENDTIRVENGYVTLFKWQKNHSQPMLTLKTTYPAKPTNKNADHSEADEAAASAEDVVAEATVATDVVAEAAASAVEETDVAAADSEIADTKII